MPYKPEIWTVAEFRKLKGASKKPVVIYFDAKQLKNLMGDLKPLDKAAPENTLRLMISELPGLPGGLGIFLCPISCSRMSYGEGRVRCDCKPNTPFPGPGGGTVDTFCFMNVRSNGSITCTGKCSDKAESCRLSSWSTPNSQILTLTCGCG